MNCICFYFRYILLVRFVVKRKLLLIWLRRKSYVGLCFYFCFILFVFVWLGFKMVNYMYNVVIEGIINKLIMYIRYRCIIDNIRKLYDVLKLIYRFD